MASRRRRRKSIGKVIVDVERRVRRVEKRPGPKRLKRNVVTTEKLGFRAVTTKVIQVDAVETENIAPDAVTPIEASFGVNIVSTTEPDPEYLKPGTQWIDPETGDAKIYDAEAEVFVDVAAIDAVAREAATAAETAANGKNKVVRSTSDASGTVGYVAGDIWWKMSSTNSDSTVLAQYTYDGTAWRSNTLTNAVIANLDAAKINAGFLAADRIEANTLNVDKLTAGTLRAGTVYAGDISANQITAGTISASISLTAPTINGGTLNLSTSGSTDRIVLSSSQANTISFYSSSASFPNPGEISNGIESITIQGDLVETATLFLRPAAASSGLFASYPFIKMAQGGISNNGSFMDISATDISIELGTGVSPGTMVLYQFSN